MACGLVGHQVVSVEVAGRTKDWLIPILRSIHHLHSGTHGGQKRDSEPLELESHVVVNLHVGSVNQIRVFW